MIDSLSTPVCALKLCPGVLWRGYSDGVAVFVPQTSESHILPPVFQGLLYAPQRVQIVEQDDIIENLPDHFDGQPGTRVSRSFVEELVELKIFDRLN
ncbi:hypothetical protein [Rhodoferax sp. GW822-FHT02A01]|uniref:hypothetical protein n=1 Tax=Rhodoferax sp. GW822-FHT02A01 TaxID=3141537 RepID=UPI00315DC9A1